MSEVRTFQSIEDTAAAISRGEMDHVVYCEDEGVWVCTEDAYYCEECHAAFTCGCDLDAREGLCGDCYKTAVEEADHMRQLRSDYKQSVL